MEDTIAAIATAYGEGGIGIIRISGETALPLLEEIFEPFAQGEKPVNRKMTYGRIVDRQTGQTVDECLAVYMKGPRTYTAEDVVEIDCHGSVVSLRRTLELILRSGARMAEPGEFTKRAFLNGRIDLSQAEAVVDTVRAKTEKSHEAALSQLEGALSRQVRTIRAALLDLLVNVTVNLDYPDEDIEEITYDNLINQISLIGEMIEKLRATTATGRMIRDGIRVVIGGRPNVGKSSLMNGLLRESRAIVTDVPGTTRDTIEEVMDIRGIPVYLIDTAGIHDTEDRVEKLGIQRSRDAFEQADYIILVLDGSQPLQEEDEQLLAEIRGRKSLVLINKEDLGGRISPEDLKEILPGADVLTTSMAMGSGITEVEDRIEELVYGGQLHQENSVLVTSVRHGELLRQAAEDLERGLAMARRREPLDLIEVDVRSAYDALGEMIGETVTDTVLDEVFSRFCLGK